MRYGRSWLVSDLYPTVADRSERDVARGENRTFVAYDTNGSLEVAALQTVGAVSSPSLDQLLGLAQELSQKEPSNLAVLDRQSEEQIVAAILEFDLPNVDRVAFLAQLGCKSRRIATLKASCELRTEAVEHRRGDMCLEGRVPFSDECTPRPALGRRKHFLKRCFDIWRCLSPPDLRCDTQEKRKAKKNPPRS